MTYYVPMFRGDNMIEVPMEPWTVFTDKIKAFKWIVRDLNSFLENGQYIYEVIEGEVMEDFAYFIAEFEEGR